MELKNTILGQGKEKVIILHDWFCDRTSYDSTLPFWNTDKFTFCFMDLRGYGESKNMEAQFTLEEARDDILETAEKLGWHKFHIVGHSMTGLVIQAIAAKAKDKVASMVAIAPVPADGLKIPGEIMSFLIDAAQSNNGSAKDVANMMSGSRLSEGFLKTKVEQWRATSTPEARVGYLYMFAENDISEAIKGIETPVLALAGEFDADAHTDQVMRDTFGKWYPNAQIAICKNAAHYPMQETPAYLVKLVEDFLDKNS